MTSSDNVCELMCATTLPLLIVIFRLLCFYVPSTVFYVLCLLFDPCLQDFLCLLCFCLPWAFCWFLDMALLGLFRKCFFVDGDFLIQKWKVVYCCFRHFLIVVCSVQKLSCWGFFYSKLNHNGRCQLQPLPFLTLQNDCWVAPVDWGYIKVFLFFSLIFDSLPSILFIPTGYITQISVVRTI